MSAFPIVIDRETQIANDTNFAVQENGMELRDYFAAKAMQSYCGDKEIDKNTSFAVIAIMSYEMANAMMEARKQ